MVHRSLIGSMERAVAHLIEVHGGAFPAWLAPVQLVVLPVSDDGVAGGFCCRRSVHGPRAAGGGRLAWNRVRWAHGSGSRRLVPYQAVIGPKEVANEEIALRLRDGRRLDPMSVESALGRIGALVGARSLELWG